MTVLRSLDFCFSHVDHRALTELFIQDDVQVDLVKGQFVFNYVIHTNPPCPSIMALLFKLCCFW